MKRPFVLVSPRVPEEIKNEVKRKFNLRLYREGKELNQPDLLAGCILVPEDWPVPQNISGLLNEDSVLFWDDGSDCPETVKSRKKVLGTLGGVSGQDLMVLKMFLKGLENNMTIKETNHILERVRGINRELLNVGISLSTERNNDKLLDLILLRIRQLTRSDAGSLYLLMEDEETGDKSLLFKIAHNDSNPTDFTEFSMPLNKSSIAGYVAVTGEVLNISDVYELGESSQVKFNKSYDQATGYRTKSVLTVPMADHQGNINGVIQLINRKKTFDAKLQSQEDVDLNVLEYDKNNESIILSLASQAAVSLENNRLYNEIQTLFEGFVRASVKAIESRDPTTSGHSNRVAVLTVKLAEAVSEVKTGEFADVEFSPDEMLELRYASLLHDFGKVGVREAVLVKSNKLYPGKLEEIESRFDTIAAIKTAECLKERMDVLRDKGYDEYSRQEPELLEKERNVLGKLDFFLEKIEEANVPRVLEGEAAEVLNELENLKYHDMKGREKPYLTPEEVQFLGIKRGNLNDQERKEIQSHVEHSYDFLSQIPWSRSMKNVPSISRSHHEVLTGTGYPQGLKGDDIPLQSQLMTIADIFDALTARDRPYKKALPREKAMNILREESEAGKINKELLRIFEANKLHELDI